eukprot:14250585-Alexandrium_andersonii.AAC.1
MSGRPDSPPGLEAESRPPPKRQRGAVSAPPASTRTALGSIAEEGIGGGAPVRARPPGQDSGSRLRLPSYATTVSEAGGVFQEGRLPRASSRPASLGPA